MLAAYKGHVAEMEIMVANGADVAATDTEGSTALHTAALGGHLAAMKWLAEQDGSDTAATTDDKTPPLHSTRQWCTGAMKSCYRYNRYASSRCKNIGGLRCAYH
jgi:hypothetical protein